MKKILIISISILFSLQLFSQNCVAEYTYTIDSVNQTIQFTDISYTYDTNIVATEWIWTVDSNQFSTNQNPLFSYNSSPLYICLDVAFDTTCSSTICDTIFAPTNPLFPDTCAAAFSYNLDSLSNEYTFTNNSSSNIEICNYYWDFGDGSISNLENPTHTYPNAGNYNTCLLIESSNDSCNTITCVDSICQIITVPNDTTIVPIQIDISGNVYAKTALLPEGIAVLYKIETGTYTAINYTQITNGYYIFNNLDTGNYLVHAIPYFGDLENYYPLYYPTYSGNKSHYANALIIYADSIETQDISLSYNENINHGNGYISGKVVYDNNSNFETNIYNQNWFTSTKSNIEGNAQNTTVFLKNSSSDIIRYSLTNENGDFEFKNVPYGSNIVYTEKAGKQTQIVDATLNLEADTIKNILIHIEDTEIINVNEIKEISANIYPNPFNSEINIDFNRNVKSIIIYVFDITGKLIFSEQKSLINSNKAIINTSKIKKGSYVLVVKSGNSTIIRKKIIK